LAAVLGLTALATACLAWGLWDLAQRRAAAPSVVAVDKATLADALSDAPWISSGGNGPVVWLVTAPDCAPCRTFERRALPDLLDRGVEARVILVAPRVGADFGDARQVAALARRRDWVALHTWMAGGGDRTGAALEAAATEGYLEWGRASYDRITQAVERNGLKMAVPAVFWRAGPEWRASVRPDERAIRFLHEDLAPGE
jgi:hypothetical protein